MKRRIALSVALFAGLIVFASADAKAFHLFGGGGCAEASCCAPEPSCGCDHGCGHRHFRLFGKHRGHRNGCCEASCHAEPVCAAPVEASCCAPEPTCGCDHGCGHRRHCGLFGWFKHHRGHGCCESTCAAEPVCAAPVEASCCAPEPTCGCDHGCGHRRHCGLFGWFKHHRGHGCCDSGCEPTCGAEPSCGCH